MKHVTCVIRCMSPLNPQAVILHLLWGFLLYVYSALYTGSVHLVKVLLFLKNWQINGFFSIFSGTNWAFFYHVLWDHS